MNQQFFLRSVAAATMIGMLSVTAPAFAQQSDASQSQSTQAQPSSTNTTTNSDPQRGTPGHPVTESNEGPTGNDKAQPAPAGYANGGMDAAQCTRPTTPTDEKNAGQNQDASTGTTTSPHGVSSGTQANAQANGSGTHCPTTSTRPVPGSKNTASPTPQPSKPPQG